MLLAAALAAMACPPATEAQVRVTYDAWLVAYRARDLAGTMAIFDPGVRFAFQGAPDVDWTALRRSYQAEFAATASSEWRPQWDQIMVSGDMAVAFASWREYVGGSDAPRAENRSVDVFRRGEGCRWRIVRSLNYPLRPARAAA
jgi:ketosteroid isomerase-like protein